MECSALPSSGGRGHSCDHQAMPLIETLYVVWCGRTRSSTDAPGTISLSWETRQRPSVGRCGASGRYILRLPPALHDTLGAGPQQRLS
jgi:hypothetical protein